MGNHVALRWARTPWLALLLLATLSIRTLIPVGYMPGPGGLMLCPGYAPIISTGAAAHHDDMPGMAGMSAMPGMDMSDAAMPMGQDGKAPSRGGMPSQGSMGMCPFAAATVACALLHAPTVVAFTLAVQFVVQSVPQVVLPRTQVPSTRLPRGPPAFA